MKPLDWVMAARGLVYATGFVLIWGWLAVRARELDSILGGALPELVRPVGIGLMLLGVPTMALIAAPVAHRALDPVATEAALALSGFVVAGVLLLLLARIASRTSAALAPCIVTAPIEPAAVRLLNNRHVPRS